MIRTRASPVQARLREEDVLDEDPGAATMEAVAAASPSTSLHGTDWQPVAAPEAPTSPGERVACSYKQRYSKAEYERLLRFVVDHLHKENKLSAKAIQFWKNTAAKHPTGRARSDNSLKKRFLSLLDKLKVNDEYIRKIADAETRNKIPGCRLLASSPSACHGCFSPVLWVRGCDGKGMEGETPGILSEGAAPDFLASAATVQSSGPAFREAIFRSIEACASRSS